MKDRLAAIKRFTALLFVMLLLASSSAAQNASPKDLVSSVDEYLSGLSKQNRFSGSVLIARDGKVLFSRGYGMADYEDDVPNTPQTKFRLGSVTKQFTAMAVMMLQERGKLNVQDSICKYLTECPAAWQPVTIHHLLTHTSGIWSFSPASASATAIPATSCSVIW